MVHCFKDRIIPVCHRPRNTSLALGDHRPPINCYPKGDTSGSRFAVSMQVTIEVTMAELVSHDSLVYGSVVGGLYEAWA